MNVSRWKWDLHAVLREHLVSTTKRAPGRRHDKRDTKDKRRRRKPAPAQARGTDELARYLEGRLGSLTDPHEVADTVRNLVANERVERPR